MRGMPVAYRSTIESCTDGVQIHSADELVLTELVLENVLAEYEPEEIVALLSAFVFQEKTDVEPTLTASLERGVAKIVQISEKVNDIQTKHQVILSADDSNDFVSKPRFGMVEVVYEWARGMSFNRITDLTDVMEGTIVRVITRLDETCREVKNAARIIGDPTLFQKMGSCQELIKRYLHLLLRHPVPKSGGLPYGWVRARLGCARLTNFVKQGHLQLCQLVPVIACPSMHAFPGARRGDDVGIPARRPRQGFQRVSDVCFGESMDRSRNKEHLPHPTRADETGRKTSGKKCPLGSTNLVLA